MTQSHAGIEAIVGKLTKAQRREILDGRETLFGKQVVLSNRINSTVADNLMNAGLAVLHDPYRLRLTPLGTTAAQYLRQKEAE